MGFPNTNIPHQKPLPSDISQPNLDINFINMKIRHLLTLALTAASLTAAAVPARPGMTTVSQPDGSEITVLVTGDERSHRVYTPDGFLLSYDENIGYCYATVDTDGLPAPSFMKASDISLRTSAEKEFVAGIDTKSVEKAFLTRENFRASMQSLRKSAPAPIGRFAETFPAQGEQKAIVILVEFANKEFSTTDPHDYFSRMLNEEGFSDLNATGSARDWFIHNSKGQFLPQFDLYGPVKLSHNYSYYGANDAYGNDRRPGEMIIEACEALDETVDFSEYDRDGDGIIDNVFVFFAGRGEADGGGASTIWPHSFNITESYPGVEYFYDGVQLDGYGCAAETDGKDRTDGIGTFVHEFSHVIGLPDHYSTAYSGSFTPGAWDVLDIGPYNNNGRTPPNYSGYERFALGWLKPQVIEESGTVSLNPLQQDNHALMALTDNPNEFFFIENRQNIDNDAFVPGHGLLVWHVDFNLDIWMMNSVNNNSDHQRVDIIEADGKPNGSTRAGDCFPGTANVTSFTPTTRPAFLDWNGNSLGISLTEITESTDGVVTMKVKYSGAGVDTAGDHYMKNAYVRGREIVTDSDTLFNVFDLSGRHLGSAKASAPLTIEEAGIYIATDGISTVKLIVK